MTPTARRLRPIVGFHPAAFRPAKPIEEGNGPGACHESTARPENYTQVALTGLALRACPWAGGLPGETVDLSGDRG